MFRKDKLYLWRLCLLIGGIILSAIVIFRIIRNLLEGNPAFDQNTIFGLIVGVNICISSFLWMSKPETGVAGDERTKRAVEKAGFWAYLILLGCLMLLGIANSLWEQVRDFSMMPFLIISIGLFSWGILTYYFDKKGDVE